MAHVDAGFIFSCFAAFAGLSSFAVVCSSAKLDLFDRTKNDKEINKDKIALYISSLCYLVSEVLLSVFYVIISNPSTFNITITPTFCQYFALSIPGVLWYFSRYFFYIFMVSRISVIVNKTSPSQISTRLKRITLCLIHV